MLESAHSSIEKYTAAVFFAEEVTPGISVTSAEVTYNPARGLKIAKRSVDAPFFTLPDDSTEWRRSSDPRLVDAINHHSALLMACTPTTAPFLFQHGPITHPRADLINLISLAMAVDIEVLDTTDGHNGHIGRLAWLNDSAHKRTNNPFASKHGLMVAHDIELALRWGLGDIRRAHLTPRQLASTYLWVQKYFGVLTA